MNGKVPATWWNVHSVRVCAGLAFVALLSGCINWADAPYMDTTDALSKSELASLRKSYPQAKLTGKIYRTHMENRWGRYRIVSRLFLFAQDGSPFRGVIDASGLSTCAITFADRLPVNLRQQLFDDQGAPISGGTRTGKAWSFTENGEQYIEFEFDHAGRNGFCRTGATGTSCLVQYFQPARP